MCDKVPRILVTGASGLLGRAVIKVLKEKEWKVVGIAFSRVGPGLRRCDLTNEEDVSTLIKEEKPDVIIHAAAQRFPDIVENKYEETVLLNVKTSALIASIAHEIGCKMIHISTDYVFDGSAPPYTVEDKCNPLSKYGQTKLDSEQAILTEVSSACILRVPVLYGPVERLEESAVTCLLGILKSKEPKSVSHYDKRCPAHVHDVAHILCDMITLMMKVKLEMLGEYERGVNRRILFKKYGIKKSTIYDIIHAKDKLRPKAKKIDTG
ncbi:methionine adenosyltransferase 2 subunit beta-like [Homarus americanus]|uniref:methionine adenosyltransferase 2 subunit beta-like n=1 Tax=Homarus americanus TaxID=6706 RepID=UPI001C48A94B|nr:methionine adenosyltransferase 2 subunit beta-like [Homarus americanus]